MKHVKILFLMASVAAALLASVGTASATTVTSDAGSTPTIVMTSGTTTLHAPHGEFLSVSCHSSTLSAPISSHGPTVTAGGALSILSFSNCTNGTVTVVNNGSIEIHKDTTTGDGIVTSTGTEILFHTSTGPTCTAKTNQNVIGTLTGAANGKKAVLDVGSSSIPLSGFLCPTFGVWTGNYTVSGPLGLTVH